MINSTDEPTNYQLSLEHGKLMGYAQWFDPTNKFELGLMHQKTGDAIKIIFIDNMISIDREYSDIDSLETYSFQTFWNEDGLEKIQKTSSTEGYFKTDHCSYANSPPTDNNFFYACSLTTNALTLPQYHYKISKPLTTKSTINDERICQSFGEQLFNQFLTKEIDRSLDSVTKKYDFETLWDKAKNNLPVQNMASMCLGLINKNYSLETAYKVYSALTIG